MGKSAVELFGFYGSIVLFFSSEKQNDAFVFFIRLDFIDRRLELRIVHVSLVDFAHFCSKCIDRISSRSIRKIVFDTR